MFGGFENLIQILFFKCCMHNDHALFHSFAMPVRNVFHILELSEY